MPTRRYADKPLLPKTYKATDDQLKKIEAAARTQRITASELIRRAVDQYLQDGETMEHEMKYRQFTITGKVYSGNVDHARHTVYWAIRNSEHDSEILIDKLDVEPEETK